MIEAAANKRDRAIIVIGYEAGLRIGELSSLSWKNVVFTDWGVKLKVSGKTGERVIPVVMSAGYLREWLLEHLSYNLKTGEIDPESLVLVRINGKDAGKPITYQMFAKIIRKAAKKAGINKRVHPHILRHSRATVLANHLTEQKLSHYFGWVQGSSMPAVYVHLSGRDIEDAIKKIYGIDTGKDKEEKFKPIKCPRCGEINFPTARFCFKCGLILDEKERLRIQLEESKAFV